MPIVQTDLDLRFQIEAKDAINQFAAERANFMRDTCIEVSTSDNFTWTLEARQYVVPAIKTDWIALQDDFYALKQVQYQDKFFEYISEQNYIEKLWQVQDSTIGYYRIRWNPDETRFEFCLINGPEAGVPILGLVKKVLADPTKFPPFMEEVLLRGSISRFLAFLEGEDLDSAIQQKNEYIVLLDKHSTQSGNQLNGKPRRSKTNAELISQYSQNVRRL